MTLESNWLDKCPYYNSRVLIYPRKMFIRLATGQDVNVWPPHFLQIRVQLRWRLASVQVTSCCILKCLNDKVCLWRKITKFVWPIWVFISFYKRASWFDNWANTSLYILTFNLGGVGVGNKISRLEPNSFYFLWNGKKVKNLFLWNCEIV